MIMFAYSIYDVASQAYMRPFFMMSDGQAIRTFTDIATDADHEIGKHPEDYTLFRIGQFNDNTGEMVGQSPEKIATALERVASTRMVDQDKMDEMEVKLKGVN